MLGVNFNDVRAQTPEITDIRFGINKKRTRIVIDSTSNIKAIARTETSPPRLIIDLPNVRWTLPEGGKSKPRGLAKALRYGRIDERRTRIVIDTKAPARIVAELSLPPNTDNNLYRTVIDIVAGAPPETAAPESPVPESSVPESSVPESPAPKSEKTNKQKTYTGFIPIPFAKPEPPEGAFNGQTVQEDAARPPAARPLIARPLIAIDAGHGGIDPGAIAISGELEKDVTLAMAIVLGETLEATGLYKTMQVRTGDTFIRLRNRIRIARDAEADILLSLHADSIKDPAFRGSSVYTLSENASDHEAGLLASKENKADIIGGTDLSHHDPVVTSILIDLAQRDTNNKSIDLADLLIDELGKVTKLVKNTRRYAGFAVLKSPDTPSTLIELGYLSNKNDASNLIRPDHQKKLANAITKAINRYFSKLRPPL